MSDVPKVNAIVDEDGPERWRVTCWDYDIPSDRMEYTIRAASDNDAAQEGIRRFLAERAH